MAKQNTPNTKLKADIDFENELCFAANKLCGIWEVVMANSAMTSECASEKNVREYILRHNMVDFIVQLPNKLFLTTGIPACLFILSKKRDGRDGEHRQRQQEVLFIDARKLGRIASRRLRVFHDEGIAKVADTYHQWCNRNGNYTEFDGFCKAATLPEIEANNFVLSPGRYVGSEAEETDGVPFEESRDPFLIKIAC